MTLVALDGMHNRSGQWSTSIEAWMITLRAAGRPATTIRLRRYQLDRLATGVAPIGPWELTGEQLVTWAGAQAWGAETRRSFRSAVRAFYRWALDAALVVVDPSRALPAVKPADPNPRPTPEAALRVALAGADERTRLMVRLAAELGMRRGEVAQLHTTDLERDLTGWTVRVHGKGAKIRRVPASDGLAAAIRLMAPAGRDAYVFPGNDRGHLSAHYVGKLVSRVLPEGWAMHSLRHRFATLAYSFERDTFTVQELLGHASPATTRRYVRVPADSLRRTITAVAQAS